MRSGVAPHQVPARREDATALTGWTSGPLNDALHRLLTWELNRLLKQADLYSTGAFAKVPLSEEAQALARTQPSGIELVRLNRMLLEEAYLEALARSPHTAPPPLVFYREGEPAPFDPAEATGPALYQRKGYWVTRALDSRKYRCQWHRIELDLASLPPGSQVSVSTYAADQDDGSPSADSLAWQPGYAFVGELQRPTGTAQGKAADRRSLPDDFLVQSHEGQYLWLKIELQGDGFNSPAVKGIRVHFPRVVSAISAGDLLGRRPESLLPGALFIDLSDGVGCHRGADRGERCALRSRRGAC